MILLGLLRRTKNPVECGYCAHTHPKNITIGIATSMLMTLYRKVGTPANRGTMRTSYSGTAMIPSVQGLITAHLRASALRTVN